MDIHLNSVIEKINGKHFVNNREIAFDYLPRTSKMRLSDGTVVRGSDFEYVSNEVPLLVFTYYNENGKKIRVNGVRFVENGGRTTVIKDVKNEAATKIQSIFRGTKSRRTIEIIHMPGFHRYFDVVKNDKLSDDISFQITKCVFESILKNVRSY